MSASSTVASVVVGKLRDESVGRPLTVWSLCVVCLSALSLSQSEARRMFNDEFIWSGALAMRSAADKRVHATRVHAMSHEHVGRSPTGKSKCLGRVLRVVRSLPRNNRKSRLDLCVLYSCFAHAFTGQDEQNSRQAQRSERWMYRSAGPNWRIQVNSLGYMYLSGKRCNTILKFRTSGTRFSELFVLPTNPTAGPLICG